MMLFIMTDSDPFLKQILALERRITESDSKADFPHKVYDILSDVGPWDFQGLDNLKSLMPRAQSISQYYAPKEFGKFNLTLVNNGTFFITLMYMDQIGTEIHDHPFWGCFIPLVGSPFEVSFSFNPTKSINNWADVGELVPESAMSIEQHKPRMIEENTVHLLSRSQGGQFSLLVAQILPTLKTSNHFFYYPGFRLKNRTDYSYILRLLTLMETIPLKAGELNHLFEKLELDEVFRMLQFSRYSGNKTVQAFVERFIQENYSEYWTYVDSHDSYMLTLQKKLALLRV
jgi:hypothetical protein